MRQFWTDQLSIHSILLLHEISTNQRSLPFRRCLRRTSPTNSTGKALLHAHSAALCCVEKNHLALRCNAFDWRAATAGLWGRLLRAQRDSFGEIIRARPPAWHLCLLAHQCMTDFNNYPSSLTQGGTGGAATCISKSNTSTRSQVDCVFCKRQKLKLIVCSAATKPYTSRGFIIFVVRMFNHALCHKSFCISCTISRLLLALPVLP